MTSFQLSATPIPRNRFAALIFAFLLSGMCALAYQVVWARMLSLVFGSTNQAISTVLAVFMLGLALGSHLGGKISGRGQNLGRIYGLLEITLGLYALLFPLLLSKTEAIHSLIFSASYDSVFTLGAYRFLIVLALLIIPTSLMGATLPILAQYIEKDAGNAGSRIGSLYAINTLGAALGSFTSAFVLRPYYGLDLTIDIAALLNIAVGVGCFLLLHDRLVQDSKESSEKSKKQKKETNKTTSNDGVTPANPFTASLLVLVLIGAIGMLLENAWSHALVLVFGTSVYAFATMLTAYLIGLSLGCFFAARFLMRYCSMGFLGILLFINGAAILGTTPFIGFLPSWFVSVFGDMQAQWHTVMAKEFLACASLMIIPTFIGGSIFPLCLHIIAKSRKDTAGIGVSTSIAYVWNTVGSIFGALAAGFVIIPLLGSERCLIIAASLSFVGSAAAVLSSQPRTSFKKAYVLAISLASLIAPVFLTTWDATKMNAGVYVYSKFFDSENAMEREMKNYDLVFYKEGSASVAVLESSKGHRFLRVNGKTDGSSEGDNTTQMLLGYLPYLYARDTADALVVGLGTGITSACVLDLPVNSVESIEISPEVVEAASYFSTLNESVFSDPRSVIRILDGRTWLASMPKKYDMIISEPSNPWQTGNANLFTVDFFRIAGERLNDGGILCQWIPYYNMDSSHFKLIIKSLQSVFPYVHLWMSGTDTFLLSSMQPLKIKAERINNLFDISNVRKKLTDMHIETQNTLLSFYYLDSNSLECMTNNIKSLNTDSFPVVEFHSPKFLLGPNRPDIFFDILEASYTSPLVISDPGMNSDTRFLHRRSFFSRWRIPSRVTEMMIERSLSN